MVWLVLVEFCYVSAACWPAGRQLQRLLKKELQAEFRNLLGALNHGHMADLVEHELVAALNRLVQ
jgi:hypothetical protein